MNLKSPHKWEVPRTYHPLEKLVEFSLKNQERSPLKMSSKTFIYRSRKGEDFDTCHHFYQNLNLL